MSEKHIGEVVQVIGPVLDIRFGHDELPAIVLITVNQTHVSISFHSFLLHE